MSGEPVIYELTDGDLTHRVVARYDRSAPLLMSVGVVDLGCTVGEARVVRPDGSDRGVVVQRVGFDEFSFRSVQFLGDEERVKVPGRPS